MTPTPDVPRFHSAELRRIGRYSYLTTQWHGAETCKLILGNGAQEPTHRSQQRADALRGAVPNSFLPELPEVLYFGDCLVDGARRHCLIRPFVPGLSLTDYVSKLECGQVSGDLAALGRQIGTALQVFHSLSAADASWCGQARPPIADWIRQTADNVRHTLGLIEQAPSGRSHTRLSRGELERIRALLPDAAVATECTSGSRLVHGDLHGGNLIVDQQGAEWSLAAIIDEGLSAGDPQYDLVTLISWSTEVLTPRDRDLFCSALVEAYPSHHDFTANHPGVAQLYHLDRSLGRLAYFLPTAGLDGWMDGFGSHRLDRHLDLIRSLLEPGRPTAGSHFSPIRTTTED
ncbi:phosphotransferase family protein [Kribbella sp. NPDC058245]|uniref:phosphotransferase family protein n=1 Tax=Kribbella sp. NPDC058245 TaxID=3346399 RepID=UPI0036E17FFC